MQIEIRSASESDIPAVVALMRELAAHEGHTSFFKLTPEALREACLGSAPRVHVLVAASPDAVVGYAAYMFQFSPWIGRDYMFLDDLYVSEQARGAGIGARLMRRIAEIALERDVDVRWHVEMTNESAQRFYRSVGAVLRDRLIAYWTPDAMRAQLAAED